MATDSDTAPGGLTDHHFPVSRAKNDRMLSIADNLENVRQTIQKATKSASRSNESVTLLAVSKTQPAERLLEAMRAGQRHFGENYLQEALDKQQSLQSLCSAEEWQQLCWHFIGPLQSNKTRAVAEHFDWVHSVDRLKIARRLSEQRPTALPPLQICLQVNIDAEDSKAGVLVAELSELAKEVASLPRLNLRGLMAIPSAKASADETTASFAQMRRALEDLQSQYPGMDTLSMGMSGDLELAITEGATIVRIGEAIFGARAPKPE